MHERFNEGLKKSSSKAKEFVTATDKEKLRLFVDFIEGIKLAAGSAHALAHYQENPKWLDVRDLLENIITVSTGLPQLSEGALPLWGSIKTSLDQMIVTGEKLYTMKAMTRVDVLQNLEFRQKAAHLLSNSDTERSDG